MLDSALYYAENLGLRVFPIRPRAKEPLTTHGFKDATTEAGEIRDWWGRWPDANIGLATGFGLVVVDLDVNPLKGKDGINDWHQMGGNLNSAHVRTGSGGIHLYYRIAGEWRNRKLGNAIDTRGDGGYVLAPPSIHPNGKPYEWVVDPVAHPFAELPAFVAAIQPGNLAGLVQNVAPAEQMEAYERCKRYLQTMPDAISGAGGHDATYRAACEIFRFGLTESQAWDVLNWFNVNKCHPAWSEKELRHKLRQGRKCVDAEGRHGEHLERDTISTIALPATSPPAVEVVEQEPQAEPAQFPSRLLVPPGLVGEICQWINATAIKPQPILALANTLAFFGAVIGRRVRTKTNLRTNLYTLGVGESGSGKDYSRQAIKRICDAAEFSKELLGGEEVASDAAIMGAVYRASNGTKSGILFQFDEIGHMLSQANSRYAPAHMKNIGPTFMRLFSSAGTSMIGKEYNRSDRQDIDQPNACIYGTTVPCRLFEGLTSRDITDGFLPRMLVFISNDPDPREIDVDSAAPVPESIINSLKLWYGRPHTIVNITTKARTSPMVIPFNNDAEAIMSAFSAEVRELKAAGRDGGGHDVLWTRAIEHARKVAITIACGCEFAAPIVTGDICEFSVSLVRHLITIFIDAARSKIVESQFGREVQKIDQLIRAAKTKGISKNELTRKIQFMPPNLRRDALQTLIESGQVQIAEIPTATRKATRFICSQYVKSVNSLN